MGSILDAYKTDVEATSNDIGYDLPKDAAVDGSYDMEQYKTELDNMRKRIDEYDRFNTIDGNSVEIKDVTEEHGEDPYKDYIKSDEDKALAEFMREYPYTAEDSLKTERKEGVPHVVRAYCPDCGKEIVCEVPAMFNPFTFQKVIRYECKCGWKANLEHTYPRVVFVTSDGDEIECYGR